MDVFNSITDRTRTARDAEVMERLLQIRHEVETGRCSPEDAERRVQEFLLSQCRNPR